VETNGIVECKFPSKNAHRTCDGPFNEPASMPKYGFFADAASIWQSG
jgi:hypothetical protein